MPRVFQLLLLLLLSARCCTAQKQLLRHYTVYQGLPSNTIYSAFQDSRGFIWFCTNLGVSRFDGHRFENYSSKNGLPDNEIFQMTEDTWQRKWLLFYNRKSGYILDDKVYSASNDRLCRRIDSLVAGINHFFHAEHDLLLCGTNIFALGENSISPVYKKMIGKEELFYFRHENKEYFVDTTKLMVLGAKGPYVLLENQGQFKSPFYHNGHLYTYISSKPAKMFLDIELKGGKVIVNKITVPYRIFSFHSGRENKIWCCTEAGIYVYDHESKRIEELQLTTLPSTTINSVFTDAQQRIWYMTADDGVYMQLPSTPYVFNQQTGLVTNSVQSIATMAHDKLLAGYSNGCIDLIANRSVTRFKIPVNHRFNKVRYLISLNSNEFLAGCDHGAFRLNIASKEWRFICPFPQKSAAISGKYCLLGYNGGAGLYNTETGTFREIYYSRVTAAAMISPQKFWLGGNTGLYFQEDQQLKKFDADPAISQERITSLFCDGPDKLIIGTNTNGIYIHSWKSFVHLDESKGLSSNICRKVTADSCGHIWLVSDKGLDKISPQKDGSYTVRHFSYAEGLEGAVINDILFRGRKAYLATSAGIIVIDPNAVANDTLSGIYVLSAATKDSVYRYPRQVTLRYNQNNLSVDYTAISIPDGSDVTYKYLLQGVSADTVYTSNNSINLSAIKPGNLRLLIWAAGKNMLWSKEPATLVINVLPPFWQRLWFLAFSAGLIILALLAVYKKRVDYIKRAAQENNRRKRQITELEMQALRAQINPHFMFNALNAIQNYYNQRDEQRANYYLSAFARLIRETLTYSKEHWITIAAEMSMLEKYIKLEQMRFKNKFDFEINVDRHIIQMKIPAMLLQVYVENAIIHGLRHLERRRGKLTVSCSLQNRQLICIVHDNGIGFTEAAGLPDSRPGNHVSMGLKNTEERIATINELYHTNIKLTIEHTLREGALVKIIIPVKD